MTTWIGRSLVSKARADLDALWTQGGQGTNVKAFGARGDGSHDDTQAFEDAIDSVAADGGGVHVPAGMYVSTGVDVPPHVSLFGDGSAASVISCGDPDNGYALKVTAGAAQSVKNSISGIGFYDPNGADAKTALVLSDVSSCRVDDIYVYGVLTGTPSGPYWKGTGLKTMGREVTGVSNYRIVTTDIGINFAANPNTTRTNGEDIDHWNFHNGYIVTDNTTASYNVKADDGIGLIDLSFTGYHALVGSRTHVKVNDTRVTPTIVSRNVVFDNVRTEQCGDANGWGWDCTWTQPIETFAIRNALISATSQGISLNGYLQVNLDTVIAATAAGKKCFASAGTVGGSTLTVNQCYWQPGSVFDSTGLNAIITPCFETGTTVAPSTAVWANTLNNSATFVQLLGALCAAGSTGLRIEAVSGDGFHVLPQAAGSGVGLRSMNTARSDFEDFSITADGFELKQRTGVGTSSDIFQVATGTTPKIGFFGVTPVARQLLAHGCTADQIADALAAAGLTRLS